MLRASSQQHDETVALEAIMDGTVDSGIAHGEQLAAFAEAAVSRDTAAIRSAREALIGVIGVAAMIDAAGVISNFQRMTRIADSSGIGLGHVAEPTADLRQSLGIEAFR